MSGTAYASTTQVTLLLVLRVLGQCGLDGVDVALVASTVGCTRDQAFRSLHSLAALRWVEQRGQRWYPAEEMARHAYRVVRAHADQRWLHGGAE